MQRELPKRCNPYVSTARVEEENIRFDNEVVTGVNLDASELGWRGPGASLLGLVRFPFDADWGGGIGWMTGRLREECGLESSL